MVKLTRNDFLREFETLLDDGATEGGHDSVRITMKRVVPKKNPSGHHCLVRATLGDRKLSCEVDQTSAASFHDAFQVLQRSKTNGQKKRDRKKKKKKQAKPIGSPP